MKKSQKRSQLIPILADAIIGISDLKRNPAAVFAAAEGRTLLVMNHSRPAAYIVSTAAWEGIVCALRELREIEGLKDKLSGIAVP